MGCNLYVAESSAHGRLLFSFSRACEILKEDNLYKEDVKQRNDLRSLKESIIWSYIVFQLSVNAQGLSCLFWPRKGMPEQSKSQGLRCSLLQLDTYTV